VLNSCGRNEHYNSCQSITSKRQNRVMYCTYFLCIQTVYIRKRWYGSFVKSTYSLLVTFRYIIRIILKTVEVRVLNFDETDTLKHTRRCNQKFPNWLSGAKPTNDASLCHYVQLYRYFVSQSSEFCRHNPLRCFSTCVCCCCCCCWLRYPLISETFGYTPRTTYLERVFFFQKTDTILKTSLTSYLN
jgi:hypothetical protein